MTLKKIAAAALVAATVPAFAGIETISPNGEAELFGIVWDEAVGTYAIDFGITLAQLQNAPAGTSVLGSVDPSLWSQYTLLDTNLNDYQPFEGTRWGIVAVADIQGFAGAPGTQEYYTTLKGDVLPTTLSDGSLEQTINAMGTGGYALTLGFSGMTLNPANHLSAVAAVGSPAHFIESGYGGGFGVFAGNAIGTTARLNVCTYGGFFDSTALASCAGYSNAAGAVSVGFNGQQFSVTAVPEPGTYAMLFAGLAAVGFMVRRRNGQA